MRKFHLPWRRRSNVADSEVVIDTDIPRHVNDDRVSFLSDIADAQEDDPILGLVGASTSEAGLAFTRHDADLSADAASPATQELVDSLQRQYWRALADPHDVLMGSWAWGVNESTPPPMVEAAESGWQAPKASSEYESIEVLLSGQRTLEDAFGQMTPGTLDEVHVEPVPEVLRLFAPPEYHAAEARRTNNLPSSLTRREYHALSVDSAFVAPRQTDNEDQEKIT